MTKNYVFNSIIVLFFTTFTSFSQTFSGTTGAIVDNNCATTPNTFSTTVSGVGTVNLSSQTIAYINVDITHTYIGDISLVLQNVNTGTTVQLVSPDIGDGGDNYTNTVFTPGSNAPISTGVAPYSAGYLPEGDLTNFNGENADGTWHLIVCDNYAVDTGTLNSWSITFAPLAPNNIIFDGYGYPINTGTQFSDFPVIANNIGATDSESSFPLGIPSGCGTTDNGGYRGGDIWYVAFVSANGTLTIETAASAGSNITDTAIAVYDDSGFLLIACNDDKSSTDSFSKIEIGGLTPGDFIFIRAWSKNNNTFGEFQISAYANNTYVPDDNFENYLETHNASGATVTLGDPTSMGNGIANDDLVPTNSINTVTDLDINSLNIVALTGIEDFTALESLICYSNQLTALNVTLNTALDYLNSGNNPINTLDVSQNTALTYLRCNDNGLTALDVSNNTLLNALRFEFNDLATIDISQNTALTYLRGNHNNLSELNMPQITSLTYLNVSNNILSELDTSLNTDLETLFCDTNVLASLDLSQNTALTVLNCSNNQLTLLDVANGNNTNVTFFNSATNPDLICIKVDNETNAITNWSGFIDVNSSFSTDCGTYVPDDNFENYLETHNTSGAVVPLADPTSLGNGIANDNYVETSRINAVTNLNVNSLGIADLTGIEDFINLQQLVANNNNLTELSLSQNPSLFFLDLVTNTLNTIDISQNSLLQYFYCSNNNLSALNVDQNTLLIELYFGDNNVSLIDVSQNLALEGIGCETNNLTELDLSNNPNLLSIYAHNNSGLTNLNLKNGNNTIASLIWASNCPLLTCVQVDDFTYSNTNWTGGDFLFDPQSYFSIDCSLNDTPEKAYTLNVGHDFADQAQIADNTNATASEIIDPSIPVPTGCGGSYDSASYNGDDVWYAVTIPDDGSIIIETESNDGSILDTGLALYSGAPGSLVQMACNDDVDVAGGDYFSIITLTSQTPNNVIYVRVWSWNNDETGTFQISAYRNPEVSTYIPDNHFEEYLEFHDANGSSVFAGDPSSMGDGDLFNKYVPTAKINTVTNLNVSTRAIADLTGIESFVALESLHCNNNLLTEIDIRNNTSLHTFTCRTNVITNLDVSINTALISLDFGNNQIASINLSNNTSINYLSCFSNQLTTLDISSLNSISTLYAGNNQLTSLNIANGNNTNLIDFRTIGNPELTCITVDNQTIADDWNNSINTPVNSFDIGVQHAFSTNCGEVVLEPKVYLQGAFINPRVGEESVMRDDLRALSHLPSTSPYADNAILVGTPLSVFGPDAIVDWIWVELRDDTDNTLVISGQSALLQRDGDIVGLDGTSPLVFMQPAKHYNVVVKHRNHLGIMSAVKQAFPKDRIQDYTTISTSAFGTNAMVDMNSTFALRGGDVNGDAIIQYSGTTPDAPSILQTVLNDAGNGLNFPTYIVNGYNTGDVNMDGKTQYTGTTPDTPFILQNVLAHPGNFLNFSTYQILEQLPEN